MEKIPDITRRVKQIKEELTALGDMRPGSLSVQSRKWGGEYLQLSYSHRGKGHTEYVRAENRAKVEGQLSTYTRFRELTKEWVDLELKRCKLKGNQESSSEG